MARYDQHPTTTNTVIATSNAGLYPNSTISKPEAVLGAELRNAANNNGLANDVQTQLFINFIEESTNYSSSCLADRIRAIKNMLKIKKEMMEEIRKDTKNYRKMNNTLKELIDTFLNIMEVYKDSILTQLGTLESSKEQLEILLDVLYPGESACNGTDVKELELDVNDSLVALNRLAMNANQFALHAKTSNQNCQELKTLIEDFQENKIQPEQEMAGKRSQFWNHVAVRVGVPIAVGGAIGGTITGGIAGSTIAGAVGTIVIGGVVFSPAGPIILSIVGGAVIIGGIAALIIHCARNSYLKYQQKVMDYLNLLSKLAHELSNDTDTLKNIIDQSKDAAFRLFNDVNRISDAVQSRHHRQKFAGVCKNALLSCENVINSIKELHASNLDQKWSRKLEIEMPAL